ncbi:hypothetical protein [Mesorhizobium sp. B2-1-2]|uniref:hypothetical protein n=1 Tax=Mesorhizobium sp. B2-1-2 TaxID=2589973 RepID=UPI001126A0C8|nr:hypothetical protein [Mesorhizobium sp. B2-1-2]TPN11741.1 hypothetical protein FJ971_10065 [Mesorhizobium sp. B2-1-2]
MAAIVAWALGTPLGRIVSGAALCLAIFLGARLWLAAHDASTRRDALIGYVQQSRLDAAEAKSAEIERQLKAGRLAAEQFAQLLAEAQAKDRADDLETEKRISEYEQKLAAKDRSCNLDGDDLEFLRRP